MPIVVVAFLTAACGGAATVSNSNDKTAPVGAVQLNGGSNAGDTSDVAIPNPSVHKPGTVVVKPSSAPLPPKGAELAPAEPAFGMGFDRCSGGVIIGQAGNGASQVRSLRSGPKMMCAVE